MEKMIGQPASSLGVLARTAFAFALYNSPSEGSMCAKSSMAILSVFNCT